MIEHRLIERMVEVIRKKIAVMEREKAVDTSFVSDAVDFIRVYADRCHHGKEEDILFRDLEKKDLSEEHARILGELVEEHRRARRLTGEVVDLNARYLNGQKELLGDILDRLRALAAMYPPHIEKEDKRFFIPCMGYFSGQEQESMLQEERDFDREFIHKLYRERVEAEESRLTSA
jgi:hemerythrin-like domain-containing protein